MTVGRTAKPRTLDTMLFALEMLRRIPRSHPVSARELHVQLAEAGFDRDLRTVQRQLDELCTHFDIERDERSKPYGYRWKENARGLSLPGLTEKESLLLALAEDHLRNLLPVEVLRSIQPFFEEARRHLSPGRNPNDSHASEWIHKVRVVSTSQPLLAPPIPTGVFDCVSTALYRNLWLDLSYRNASGCEVKARVMPLGLAQQGVRLYLVCRFDGYDNERSLAVHRIQHARCLPDTFQRPAAFDLQKFDQDGRFGFGNGRKIQLVLRITKGAGLHLIESKLSEDQVVTEEDHHYRIAATVTETEQLVWWLRGFGEAVEVLRPQRLAIATNGSFTGKKRPEKSHRVRNQGDHQP